MDTSAVDVVVTGHVQGVFFRAALREEADRRGVAGWVRNHPDGSVRAHLEGPADAVETVIGWCADGPPAARVEAVAREEADATGATGFQVA